ncbi:GDSL esterase/lipase 1-like [Pistacia vera]|uniref:GDSL esterase/lipase 1-like n=1 Tax=Pistacia vera TaxID=55513 RepID=UPI001263C989|nr:GDSL esterase/lipase 1-like [Pistacia vera]
MLCSSLLIPGHFHRLLPKKHVALFVFGDSLFDAGNNNYINTTTHYQANFWPYGESFFKYPTGRFSDGRLIPDFIAEYAGLPLVPTFLPPYEDKFIYGVNFASGGVGALVETHQGYVIDLLQDCGEAVEAKTRYAEAKTLLCNAVYLFSIGSNDYDAALTTNSSVLQSDYSKKEFIGMVISNLTTIIKEIYKTGGRKFGFARLGALGCSPRMRALVNGSSGSCSETAASELAKLHNIEFYKAMEELEKQLTGLKYSVHDFYDSGVEVMNNASRYGFKEAVMACCGSGPYRGISSCGGSGRGIEECELCENPGEYLFFDSGHPSERVNKLIAELMWSGTPNVTWPCNLKKLFEHS